MPSREFTQAHGFCIYRERLNVGLRQRKQNLPPVDTRREVSDTWRNYEPDNLLNITMSPVG